MDSFDEIYQAVAARKGGFAEVEALLPKAASARSLRRRSDDRYLAEMTACVFRSGFVWRVIENKWPNFEAAFHGFDVTSCVMQSDDDVDRLASDTGLVRHRKKIESVRRNAAYMLEVRESHGSFGAYLAAWPREDIVGLWDEMKRRGDRLGGQTGRFFLRFVGKDTPIFSADVIKALIAQGVVDKAPTSKRALAQVQQAMNQWRQESGRDFCQISRILASSV